MQLSEFVEIIAKELVDDPEAVTVREVTRDGVTVFELSAEKSDLGKLIGKKGHTAKAMRLILSAVAAKRGSRAILEIVD